MFHSNIYPEHIYQNNATVKLTNKCSYTWEQNLSGFEQLEMPKGLFSDNTTYVDMYILEKIIHILFLKITTSTSETWSKFWPKLLNVVINFSFNLHSISYVQPPLVNKYVRLSEGFHNTKKSWNTREDIYYFNLYCTVDTLSWTIHAMCIYKYIYCIEYVCYKWDSWNS